jgi:hypothetical protein
LTVTPLRPGEGLPEHIRLPLGMPKFEDMLREVLDYGALLQDFEHNPPVQDGPITRQEVATAIHTRIRWIQETIVSWELLHEMDPKRYRQPPSYWVKARTKFLEPALSACRHEMEVGSRQLTAAQHLAGERGDAGPGY